MKSCCKCGKGIISGLIICSECGMNTDVPLLYYIDQLAEHLVFNNVSEACGLCVMNECDSQQSGLICRMGVKAFLVEKIEKYTENLKSELHENGSYYDFLNKKCQPKNVSSLDMIHILMIQYPDLTRHQAGYLVATWMDIHSIQQEAV